MNSALANMLAKYERKSVDDEINALREIVQEIALCGLWRGKFFDKAAFYGGAALRVLYGLDRFSEDMDFSLLTTEDRFDLTPYYRFVEEELRAWGFATTVETRRKTTRSAVESAFLKGNTRELLLNIDAAEQSAAIHGRQQLRIKIEIDTDPPPGFSTETRFLLQPIPFSVKAYAPPSLFAGKMHAVLCRGWQSRVKGRDWYDLVWYVGRDTSLDLAHLEARMRQSEHYTDPEPLSENRFRAILTQRIEELNVDRARSDVRRFLVDPSSVTVWSRDFFHSVADRILIR